MKDVITKHLVLLKEIAQELREYTPLEIMLVTFIEINMDLFRWVDEEGSCFPLGEQ